MGNKPSNKIIFLRSLLAEEKFPEVIERVLDSRNGLPLYEKPSAKPLLIENRSFVLQDVPGYVDLILDQHQKKFSTHTIITQHTHVIELERYLDGNQYMEQHFGPKTRSSLRRYKKRLEECFDIRYEVFQGSIDKKWYNEIFEQLRTLMIRRFKEKNEENYELPHLDQIKADLYPMLLQNRATLFVIYANGEPVSIRINMMKDKLAFYILSAYNPDYDVFRLGKLDMWQNVSWFINQGYTTYDLLKGYAYIKEKWADRTYANNLVFVNEASNLWNRLKFFVTLTSVRFRHTMVKKLKYIGLDKIILRIKRRKINHLDKANYVVLPLKETEAIKTIHKNAQINLKENKSLIAPIIELAYKHRSRFNQIQVFLKNGNSKEYYIHIKGRYYVLTLC
ncbi:MAG: GNAT family N-acetyltransferase [Flavobacteriaceae bacterium]|nr:GNAT family N-acetyltransferase [Flavobacteriaceae bacterium]